MSKQFPAIFLTALLSSIIFIIIAAGNFDFILMFLATIPLFSLGLNKGHKFALQAAALATIPIMLFGAGNLFPVVLYFFIFALPCWYVCYLALRYYDIMLNSSPLPLRLWYPAGLITVYLAVYTCAVMAVATAIFATQDTNLPKYIASITDEVITTLNYEMPNSISQEHFVFLLCGSTGWLWCFLMFGCGWFVNNSLVKKKMAQRPNFMVLPFPMPHWLLTLLSICAIASAIGGESMSFLGKSSFFILLAPYFFLGASILNLNAKELAKNMFFIFIFYFIALITFWPAMVIVGIGMWNHIKLFNKHLSSGGSSSRS